MKKRLQGKTSRVEAPPLRSRMLDRFLPFTILAILVIATYANSFRAALIYDNEQVILKDPRIRAATFDNLALILTRPYWFTNFNGLYRPLTTLSYLFNYAVLGGGSDPAGYHFVNLLLHLCNVALVYWLGFLIFEKVWSAWLLGAIWGIHPVLTESVTNVIGRADLLAAFGVLAGLWCYRNAMSRNGWQRLLWLGGVGLSSAIGIFSKENAVVLVAVLVLGDLAFGDPARWAVRLWGYGIAVLPAAAYLYARGSVLSKVLLAPVPFVENPLIGADFWVARATAVKVIGKQIALWLWPSTLVADYSYNEIPLAGWGHWKVLLAAILCVGLAAAAILAWRRHRAVSFAIGFFFIAISPTSNLVILIGSIMAERFLYLPSIGLAILLTCGLVAVRRTAEVRGSNWQRAFLGIVAGLLVAAAARTVVRNEDWSDDRRLWHSAVEASPDSFRTHIRAAFTALPLTPANRDAVVADADRVIQILDGLPDSENSPEAYHDVGAIYRAVGDQGGIPGTTPPYWYRKALTILGKGERIDATRAGLFRRYNEDRGLHGGSLLNSSLYLDLGIAYLRVGEPRGAIEELEKGRALGSNPDLLENLSDAYAAVGETRKAAQSLVEVLAIDSKRGDLNSKLVNLYAKLDPGGCAVTRETGELSLNLGCPLVHSDICGASRNIAVTYDRGGLTSEAAFIRQVAARDLGCTADSLK